MNKIIFTDLDGTLTLKDTYTKFLFENLNISSVLKNSIPLTTMLLGYIRGTLDNDDVKRTTFKLFFDGYNTQKDIEKFASEIPWNKKVLAMIQKKRELGYKVIIVTASPDIYVKSVCDYLKYDGYISTKTLKDGRYLNGIIDGNICNFDEKIVRIKKFLGANQPEHTISFGNSTGDYAMLRLCDESYFVNKLDIKRFEK